MKNTPKYLIVHHTGGAELNPLADTSNQIFEDINLWHRENPKTWLGFYSKLGFSIGYTYFIDKTGKVTQGRDDTEQSAHCIGYNNNPWDSPDKMSIGICLAGNFDVTLPTPEQIKSLRELLTQKRKEYNIPLSQIIPHRHFASKSCYGNNLSEDWARSLIAENPLPPEACTAEKDSIAKKDIQISNLQKLIQYFISLYKG